ncbi:MAG: HEAT repeat domain-containing protein [Planctomycetota bacterium]|nr:HEAT repeat domain-containing protein [Planctomycetota bacterium]
MFKNTALLTVLFLFRVQAEDSAGVIVDEQQLREIHRALQQYIARKGDGRFYPNQLTDLVKEKILGKNDLRSKYDGAPAKVDEIYVSYYSAFDMAKTQLDNALSSNIPLVWTKPTTHQGINLLLLKDGRIIKVDSSKQYQDLISGWKDRSYLKSQGIDRVKSEEIIRRIREEPENQDMEATVAELAKRGVSVLPSVFTELSWFVPEQKSIIVSLVRELGEKVEPNLMADLNSREVDVRERALELLAEIRSKKAEERFRKMLSLEYKSVRIQAIEAFSVLKFPSSIPPLIELATSKDASDEKDAALISLSKFSGEEASSLFIDGLKHENMNVRLACAHGLARLGDPRVLKPLLSMLDQSKGEEKGEILASLIQLGSKDALRVLHQELNPRLVPLDRLKAALETVRQKKLMSFFPYVVALLEEADPQIQLAAVRTLAGLGNRNVIPILKKKIEEKGFLTKRAAHAAIAELEQYGPIEVVEEVLRPGDFAIVTQADTPVYQGQKVFRHLDAGTVLQVFDLKGSWFAADFGTGDKALRGWVNSAALKKHSSEGIFPYVAVASTENAKVMRGQFELTKLAIGSPVMVFETRGGWCSVFAPQGRWQYKGWMATPDLRPATLQYKDLSSYKLKMKHVAGLPQNNEPGISHMVITPDGEQLLTINSKGRLELWPVRGLQKTTSLKLDVDVIDMAFRTSDKAILISTHKDIHEIKLGEELKKNALYQWIRKDLQHVVLFPEQGRGLFPFQKIGKVASGEEEKFWRLALEIFIDTKEENSPSTPIGGDAVNPDVPAVNPDVPAVNPAIPVNGEVVDPRGKPTYADDLPTGVIKVQDSTRPVDGIFADENGFIGLVRRTTMVDVVDLTQMVTLGSLTTGAKGNQTMTLSSNGLFAATGGKDRYIRIWNTKDQKMVKIFQTGAGVISLLRFSPDSQILASYTLAGRLQFWDLSTDTMLQEIKHNDSATVLRFTPDQLYFLVGNANSTITAYERMQ